MDDHTLVGRTIEIIGAVLTGGPASSLADLTRLTGIPKPTLRRIANSLVDRQVLVHEDGTYGVGPRLLAYGARAAEQRGDREVAMPHLQEALARNPGSVVFLMDTRDPDHAALVSSVFDRFGRQYADSRWPHDLTEPAALATAVGRVVLSHYPDRVETLLRSGVPQLTGLTATTAARCRRPRPPSRPTARCRPAGHPRSVTGQHRQGPAEPGRTPGHPLLAVGQRGQP